MKKHVFAILASLVCVLVLLSNASAQFAAAQTEVQAGMKAMNDGNYQEAIAHLEKATQLFPDQANAHLYLANAYAHQYVPGIESPENNAFAEHAIEHYQKVIDIGSMRTTFVTAAKGIGYTYSQMGKYSEAKDAYGKAKEYDPTDADPFYAIAVIDWTAASQFREQERKKLGMKPAESLGAKDAKVCLIVKEKNWSNVQEGIDNLKNALELRPGYEDAMNYMNLLYVERADIECADPAMRKADLKTADEWSAKALAAKKSNAMRQSQPVKK
jgi:tetratricopeptide (TPR) repeat protein